MGKIVVGIVRGGASSEHDVSLASAAALKNALSHEEEKGHLTLIDIFIDREGVWHVRGVPKSPERALVGIDVVLNALHGEYGEDGTIQRLLERTSTPYTGSAAYPSTLAMNKAAAKREVARAGVLVPRSKELAVSESLDKEVLDLFRSFPQPCVVKPVSAGSSVGVSVVRSFEELKSGVKKAFQSCAKVLVEEYIEGREATCGIVDSFRGQNHYILPPVEIIPPQDASFFNYEAKYGGESIERCPGNFSPEDMQTLGHAALTAHTVLGLRHYSRSDFIVSKRGVYFLEVNSLPGMTPESLFPKSLTAIGSSLPEFTTHLVGIALNKG